MQRKYLIVPVSNFKKTVINTTVCCNDTMSNDTYTIIHRSTRISVGSKTEQQTDLTIFRYLDRGDGQVDSSHFKPS